VVKTLLNPRDQEEILARLQRIHVDSARQWGKMSAHQMICHVSDAFKLYMGLLAVAPPGFPYPSKILKLGSLGMPMRWPKGFRTPREIDQHAKGAPTGEFAGDVDELKGLVERFTRKPQDFEWPSHPYLGRMSEKEWMRLGYLHTDHHLRQFGA
jgi:hypothetical protein